MKRRLIFLMAFLMVVSILLSACAASETDKDSDLDLEPDKPPVSEEGIEDEDVSDGISGVNEFPFVKEPVEIVIAIPQSGNIIDYDTNEQTLHIEELTGLDIVWELLPSEGTEEKINLMFSAGSDMPDLFFNCVNFFNSNMMTTLGSQGLIEPMNDLIEKWGYNIKRQFEEVPEVVPLITSIDGNIYSIPKMGKNVAAELAQRFFINTKFMKALGIEKMPETTEEYYQYLKAVKEGDPNGNGKNDEIPLIATPDGWNQNIDGFLMQPFIYTDSDRQIYMTPEGKIEFAPVQDGWKEGVKFLNRLHSEGLISSDVFTATSEEVRALIEFENAELVGSLPAGGPNAFANATGERRKDYASLAPLKGPDGTRQTYRDPYIELQVGKGVMTSVSEKKDLAMKLMDYLYSEEGHIFGRYGVEGRDWQVPAPGTKAFDGTDAPVELIGDLKWGDVQNVLLLNHYPFFKYVNSYQQVDDGDPYNLERVLWDATVVHDNYHNTRQVPPLMLNEDEAREANEIINNLKSFGKLAFSEFVTGVRDIDTQWDAYIQEYTTIGYQRLMEIYQDAFDRQWSDTWEWNDNPPSIITP